MSRISWSLHLLCIFIISVVLSQIPPGGSVYADDEKLESLEKVYEVLRVRLEEQRVKMNRLEEQLKARTDESEGLKQELAASQASYERLEKRVAELQAQLRSLTGEEAPPEERPAVEVQPKPEGVLSGFSSLLGEWLQLGGKLEFEFVDTENETESSDTDRGPTEEPAGHFQIDLLRLDFKVVLNENAFLEGKINFHDETGRTLLKQCYAVFTGLPLESWLRAGLDKKFIKPEKRTESYPLIGSAFWRDDALGVTWGGGHKELYWRLSIANGLELDDEGRGVGEDASFELLHDDRYTSDFDNHPEVGGGLGVKHDFKDYGKVDVLCFYYGDALSSEEKGVLASISSYTGNLRDDEKMRWGGKLEYSLADLTVHLMYMGAEDGEVDRRGWYVQPSYRLRFADRRFLTYVEPIMRYDQLDLDLARLESNSLTWDRKAYTFGVLVGLYENVTLKLEYALHDEDTGGGSINNDELLLQLEIKF